MLSVQDSLVVMRGYVSYVILLVVECSILAGVYFCFVHPFMSGDTDGLPVNVKFYL